MKKEDILERLLRLDEDASLTFSDDISFKCYIVGGGAFMLMDYILRSTHDIDVLEVVPSSLQELFAKYNMNCNVRAYSDNFPTGYEERAVEIDLPTERIKFYTLSLEDLVIAKLCTTRIEQDLTDITSEKVIAGIEWELLDKLATGLEQTMLSKENYQHFLYNYRNYVRRYKK